MNLATGVIDKKKKGKRRTDRRTDVEMIGFIDTLILQIKQIIQQSCCMKILLSYWKSNFPMALSVRRGSIGRSVGWSDGRLVRRSVGRSVLILLKTGRKFHFYGLLSEHLFPKSFA